MTSQTRDRMAWLDALRLAAGLSMVGLHATSDANGLPFPDATAWERAGPVTLRTLLYMARTELFIMISAFLLLMALERRERSYGTVLSQQAERLLLPFAFWLVFYAFYNLIKASYFGYAESYLSELNNPTAWFGYILLGEIKYHMHFIPTLFPILLAYPLFQLAQRYPILGLTILVSLLAKREVDVFLWSNHQNLPGFEFALRAIKVACYLGYGMAAGALWGLYQRGRLTWCFRLSVGLVLVALVAKLEHARRIAMSGTWEWNFEPAFWADFLTPVGLFALAMSAPKGIWPELLVRLAPFSFGLYLMHPIFLDLAEIAISTLGLSPSAQVLAKILPTVLLTSFALYLVARTQALAWTIGLGPSPLRWRAHIGDRLGNIGQGR